MELDKMDRNNEAEQHHVDTSRPFSSVKEAVALFGQRIMLPGQSPTLNPKPVKATSLPSSPQVPREEFMDVLKKLEAEIKETKTEVKILKERESETEVALATLNAELHKNMSKMAKAEADAAGKSAEAIAKSLSYKERENGEEERRKELMKRMQVEYPSLAQILDHNRDEYIAKTTKKKKKPIVPLVGDLFFFFFKKKDSSIQISGPLYTTNSSLHF